MATSAYDYGTMQNSSQRRGVAMVLSLVTAVVLSPLYVNNGRLHKDSHGHFETRLWNSGFVLPMVLAGLIAAIKTTSSSSSTTTDGCATSSSSSSSSWVLRIGSSSWGLAGVLAMLLFALSWQHSVQHFFWR